ncbi:integrase, catalytic region, zinc finger, CCHC-type containing protein [Tanacetum coccineum]|uniref:Integrase, catalytic region, zinc finger, CCHC-type containing protein n=1 Tax=Tanacetum coccineum TaxID=301880 RepID=A0ABQ5I9D6_9ASTR
MHNNIIAAGLRDHPPMLATGRYSQWQSRFLRYIDTRPNGDALRKCILQGPYIPSTIIIPAVPATDDSPEVSERTSVETLLNMSLENKAHYQSEKEAIHLLLTGIRDEIYATIERQRDSQTNTPPSESAYEEDSNPEQAPIDKDMQKNLALIAKYFKKIYKPTNNNLTTSSNFRNKNVDTSPRYKNDNQTRQFGNQRTMTVAGARETIGSHVVQQTGIQCFNCKEFGHFAKECRKPKWVKDYTYHKEKMLLYKQAEKDSRGSTIDLGTDTDSWKSGKDVSKCQSYSPDMCNDDIQIDQNAEECDDEHVALANLVVNLKLDIDENKKIQNQLKKANASLAQELRVPIPILSRSNLLLGIVA